ncbi:MAG: hypothetical protein WBP93_16975 [Pyrinomonadaceae bacterium]
MHDEFESPSIEINLSGKFTGRKSYYETDDCAIDHRRWLVELIESRVVNSQLSIVYGPLFIVRFEKLLQ